MIGDFVCEFCEKFSNSSKYFRFFRSFKNFLKKGGAETIPLVRKLSKSELSLRCFRRLNFFKNIWQRAICFSAGVGPNMAPHQNSDRPDDRRRRACRQRRGKKNHLIEAAPFGRLDQM